MKKTSTSKLVLSGFFIVLGLILPFFTAQIPSIGNMLLPMHIPVLLCGFVCGGPAGILVGFILPLFRSLLFGMPPIYPTALAMAFELATYGFMTGLFYKLLPKKTLLIYINLILSMLIGRFVWGAVSLILYNLSGSAFTLKIFMTAALFNAVPGIIIQIIIIPLIVMALQRARLWSLKN